MHFTAYFWVQLTSTYISMLGHQNCFMQIKLMQLSCKCHANVYHASKAQADILGFAMKKLTQTIVARHQIVASVGKPFVAFWKLVTGLLNPISDGVGRDVILLGQVAGADVILQHLPHDPSTLLRGEGRGAHGAVGKRRLI